MHTAALGLGANLNDRQACLQKAIERLNKHGANVTARSSFYDTEPVDCVPGTPRFLNAAVTVAWPGTPQELLAVCKDIETAMGRPRDHSSDESRIIDIDILLFDHDMVNQGHLQIPHPRLVERLFILRPLNEIAADWEIPPTRQTVAEAYRALKG